MDGCIWYRRQIKYVASQPPHKSEADTHACRLTRWQPGLQVAVAIASSRYGGRRQSILARQLPNTSLSLSRDLEIAHSVFLSRLYSTAHTLTIMSSSLRSVIYLVSLFLPCLENKQFSVYMCPCSLRLKVETAYERSGPGPWNKLHVRTFVEASCAIGGKYFHCFDFIEVSL